ncbi:hypothetical protein FB561_6907 [Kribbella amoyensis]|uniref:Uncharacterized protein n=1 Tax=Kribbella amoyensis TaxID=996641 RepID=A0A561B2D7_9ACTN|nr:hypothetical protein [Kribbella amoyensis]TWD73023.1 hypothetical protein FB561_6907 [Kribbella amoyensis]
MAAVLAPHCADAGDLPAGGPPVTVAEQAPGISVPVFALAPQVSAGGDHAPMPGDELLGMCVALLLSTMAVAFVHGPTLRRLRPDRLPGRLPTPAPVAPRGLTLPELGISRT